MERDAKGAYARGDTVGVAHDDPDRVEPNTKLIGGHLSERRFMALALRLTSDRKLDETFRVDP